MSRFELYKVKMNIDKYKRFAPFIVRIALASVLLWFGISELIDPITWASLVPPKAVHILNISSETIIKISGSVEIILAVMLLVGAYTRVVAGIVILHLAGIIWALGYGDLAVRDFGLLLAAASLILSGAGPWSLDPDKV